jgi:hypothetical protein
LHGAAGALRAVLPAILFFSYRLLFLTSMAAANELVEASTGERRAVTRHEAIAWAFAACGLDFPRLEWNNKLFPADVENAKNALAALATTGIEGDEDRRGSVLVQTARDPNDGFSLLECAAHADFSQNSGILRELLEKYDFDPDFNSGEGPSKAALMAASSGNSNALRVLLEAGATVDGTLLERTRFALEKFTHLRPPSDVAACVTLLEQSQHPIKSASKN